MNKINHRLYTSNLILFLPLLCTWTVLKADSIPNPPNIVLILVDDAALMDFGAYGGEAATPHIDMLAKQGLMFTNYRTSPMCAPSRAMLMTGCDSHLTGVPNLPEFLTEEHTAHAGYEGILNDKVKTVASYLQESGYRTYITGKWHLGNTSTTLPNSRGFDRSYILGASGADNYEQKGYIPIKAVAPWFEDDQPTILPEDFYSSKNYVDKMIEFTENDADQTSPFFAYLAFQAIHIPVQAPKEYVEKYRGMYDDGWYELRKRRYIKAKELGLIPRDAELGDMLPILQDWDKLSYDKKMVASNDMAVNAAMLEAMDFHIGRYIDYLKEKGQYEHTIFIVTSDNGPEASSTGGRKSMDIWMAWNGFHRDQNRLGEKGYYGYIGPEFASAAASPHAFFKFYAGEGGVRVPLIMAGIGLPVGEREGAFTYVTDIAPTILRLAGVVDQPADAEIPMTGKDLYPLIVGSSDIVYQKDEPLGMEAGGQSSLYLGDMKLVRNGRPYGDGLWHLYNIAIDPGETLDLAKSQPQMFATMIKHYADYTAKYHVLEMGVDYETVKQIESKYIAMVKKKVKPWLIGLVILLIGFWAYRRYKKH